MGLKKKIRTLLDPEIRLRERYESLRRAATESRSFPLTAAVLLDRLSEHDRQKLQAICTRHSVADPGIRVEKYLEMETWLPVGIRRVLNIGLDFKPRARILDLGSGAGYFLYICKQLGHDVVGLDMLGLNPPWYGELHELFGIPRVIWRIDPFVPLPDLGPPFDYVCAFMVCFNRHIQPDIWKIDEWRFFLHDLSKHLNPGAVVWLELNPGLDDLHYTPELKAFLESRDAIVDGKHVIWGIDKTAYRVLMQDGKREAAAIRKSAVAAL